MKKILFYLPFIKIGGIEKVSIEYLNTLIKKGYKIDLLIDFNMGKEGNTFEYAIPNEINYQYVKSKRVSYLIYYFRTLGKKNKIFNLLLYVFMILFDFYYYHTKVKKLLVGENYEYTISFYQFLPAYLTNIKSSKHIIWLHGSVEHFFGGIKNLFKNSYEKKLNKYDFIVTIADEMKLQLEHFYPNLPKEKIKRIYNPFNFDEIKSKMILTNLLNDREKFLINQKYICTISRLDENQKDISSLILAYEELYKKNKILHNLYIIGDGPDKELLENLVFQKQLSSNVFFLGKKLNPYIWMRNSELFVLSSKFEGLPTVLIESMIVETFIISSDCKTGPKEILKNGECGDLFEVGNIKQLANKLEYALNNQKYRNNKIINAKKRIEEFSSIVVVSQFLELIKSKGIKIE